MQNNENKPVGLNSGEAKRRLEKYGPNVIRTHKKRNLFAIYLSQFKDFMIILLLIAATISIAVAVWELVHKMQGPEPLNKTEIIISFVEPLIILIVVALNSALGAYQEVKSDQAVKALEKSNELNAKVYRDGKMILIPTHEVVPGDLIVVEAGDAICADARLVESFSLQVVEAALTGESLPVNKEAKELKNEEIIPIAEKINQIFSGTYVTNGKAVAEVYATGSQTEIGKINASIQAQETNKTPLQIKLDKLSKIFGLTGIGLLVVSLVLQILLNNLISGDWQNPAVYSNALVISISLAVAAIPEGLVTFTTVLLAIGVSYMTKENVVIKAFPAIETFGSLNVVCSDKTGTLTQNKMTVVKFYDGLNPTGELSESKALSAFVACCDASVHLNDKNEYVEVGDPTETGILRFGHKNNNSAEKFFNLNSKLHALPFDSDRKMMSILVDNGKGKKFMITKGAPDVILRNSKNATQEDYDRVERWSQNALRVIAVAFKNLPEYKTELDYQDESNLTFIGLVGMIDPPRPNVKESIELAANAGIKTVMITGDHLVTAKAIGSQLGIYNNGDLVLTGAELAQLTDQELREKVQDISIYARVSPNDKLRIVKAWQSHHQVVAMTGDGVNDAPALKAADLGCAMGITGTDVSKQAADTVLVDDDFNTIVKGIKKGRETFDRIKSVILNLLVSSLTEIIIMLVGLLAFRFIFKDSYQSAEFIVLSASQLLWINLLTHGLPAIALGMTSTEENVMERKPFSKNESIFARGMGQKLIIQSTILSVLALLSYLVVGFIAKTHGIVGKDFVELTSTACFLTLGIGASLNSLNLMSKKNLFRCNPLTYKLVYLASLSSLFLVLLVAFTPGLNQMFKMINLQDLKSSQFNHSYWALPVLFGFGLLIYEEIVKAIKTYKPTKAFKN
ncbi:cation-translocating P-type ATPase [Mycoplasmopsis gallopavonis]|uniref:Calcium-transporting ATPase n=1 Tax=Mycoplasmopsis gallopavonis TaxID=76629 RepID=A0A449AYW8_9BACT|nr:cation-translocating P-type ATPase [Mycoplasmopsis gallopavonis]RIV16483.1 cation-translocating P-type ATPase [Mycoplasmopsis gallopavonis]VEU72684.1 Calcium-transporting ATPase [Mycoplasmopsis gallopavonis]